ncbi:hypothetical protein GYMLUDRAFT_830649 [Collybiopsis luxurians FD-317 M1]|uniref:Uncharacterized protein n=1 Tax=Collybiopsis luxurians FD-317 M1 TaxID=944289 RepID=A0A0D0CD14_9AGAR|nr:hypothetical protein GYMLUDRAFT_830649 [Collybiopsis luxurians FD-317 M1]
MFHQAQNFTISPSDFNVVHGNQTIIHRYPRSRRGYEDAIDENVRRKRHREHSYLDDFKEVRRGDMIVLQRIPTNQLSAYQSNHITARRESSSPGLSVKIEVVKLASKKREKKFMAITYEGDDAYERWKNDLEGFANVREANSWQLYAFTRSISPSLIFHQGKCIL